MPCIKISKNNPLREAAETIERAVTNYRNRGYSRAIATNHAALALELSDRRAKSLLYGEAFRITQEEADSIKRNYLKHLDDEAEAASKRFAAIIAERDKLRAEYK